MIACAPTLVFCVQRPGKTAKQLTATTQRNHHSWHTTVSYVLVLRLSASRQQYTAAASVKEGNEAQQSK
jgi:hypothetical protein